jgi:hypothetical protein
MHPRTQAMLDHLDKADWFSRVGVKDTQSAIVLSSWPKAMAACASVEWQNLCIGAANQYRARLRERSKERFGQWNDIVDQLKPVTIPFVRRKIEVVVREHDLPEIFEGMVQWDILHICMEAEYADVYPPGFYAANAEWYVKGHFPCGWDGDYPEGKPIIF